MVHKCTLSDRFFKSLRGLKIHQAHCKFKQVIMNRTNQDVITEEVFVNEKFVVETSSIVKSEEIDTEIEVELESNLLPYANASSFVNSTTNSLNRHESLETIHGVYEEIMQWRKNFFKLPSGNTAKMFIREFKSWLKHFNRDSEYKSIVLKVYMILPSFLVQKPIAIAKQKITLKD